MNEFIMNDIEIEDDNDDVITDPEVYYNRAFVLFDTKHYNDAFSEIEKAIRYGNGELKI